MFIIMVIKYLPMYTHYNNYIDLIIWWLIMYWFFCEHGEMYILLRAMFWKCK